MMKLFKKIVAFSLFLITIAGNAQGTTWTKEMVAGNKSYKDGKYDEASKRYETALTAKKGKDKASYNLGNAEYKQEKYDAAINHYESAFGQSTNYADKANALFNKGNAFFQKQDYDSAIKSYKDALKYDPQDKSTIENLAKAKLKKNMKEQEQKEKQDKKDKKDQKDQQDQEKKEDPQDQNEQNKDQENKQDQQKQEQQNKNEGEEKEGESQPQKQNLTRAELDRLLKMIENEEKNVQKKLTRFNGKNSPQSKDW